MSIHNLNYVTLKIFEQGGLAPQDANEKIVCINKRLG
jgi:hypothetical protein